MTDENPGAGGYIPSPYQKRKRTALGISMMILGGLLLAAQFVEGDLAGVVFLVGLGSLFAVWGSIMRSIGLIIPGGILLGIGLGTYMIQGPFASIGDPASGGVFLVCFAMGWVLITVLSGLFTPPVQYWPLIPGVILAAIGVPLILATVVPDALVWVAKFWPVILIVVGLLLILSRAGSKAE